VTKADDAREIARLVESHIMRVVDARKGWPAHVEVHHENGWHGVSLFVGAISLSGRNRDAVERRAQNPEQKERRPVLALPDTRAMVLGLWDSDKLLGAPARPVLVAFDPKKRTDTTRVSLFVSLALLQEAAAVGWTQGENSMGEKLTVFVPEMMPLYLELFASGVDVNVSPIVSASQLVDEAERVERARQLVARALRDARFGRAVREAYKGRCAVCGLNFDLVDGAHVVPVEADGSDQITNGIALCATHHRAFDRHYLWVHPETLELRWHPDILADLELARPLIASATARLCVPDDITLRPSSKAFDARYELFVDAYKWARKAFPDEPDSYPEL
jgi:hypothetical protein